MKKIRIYLGFIVIGLVALMVMAATSVPFSRLVSSLEVNEKITTGTVSMNIVHNLLNETVNYSDGNSHHDVDLVYADTVKGTQTVDLTSLTNSLGQSLSLSGQRIVAVKFKSRATNSDSITIEPGAANPYLLFGGTDYKLSIKPSQSLLFKCDTVLANVSATAKNIKFTCNSDTLDLLLITADMN